MTYDPGTGTGALGLSPELRTPAARTRRRTSGREQIPNTAIGALDVNGQAVDP
jgi:hypothetical protein